MNSPPLEKDRAPVPAGTNGARDVRHIGLTSSTIPAKGQFGRGGWPEDFRNHIIALYAELNSTYKVAQLVNRSPQDIWRFLKNRGLTNRKKRSARTVVY